MHPSTPSFSTPSFSTPAGRWSAVVATAALFVIASAGAASAHVHVEASSTAAGGSAELAFRVPTESDTASTTKVQVVLPTTTPFASVSVKAIPGWTAKVVTEKLDQPVKLDEGTLTEAPTSVTWTADKGSAVAPGEYQVFSISAWPLPKAGTTIALETRQTYSDGKVVDWNQPTPAGGEEPDLPVPSLVTTAAVAATDDDGDEQAAPVAATPAIPATADGADGVARWLGGGGLALGVIALGLAGSSSLRTRRSAAG